MSQFATRGFIAGGQFKMGEPHSFIYDPRIGGTGSMLPMIEQRIRDDVEPKVKQARSDLEAIIAIELGKLGINPDLTNTRAYASGIADKYRERLVEQRTAALVDFMVAVSDCK